MERLSRKPASALLAALLLASAAAAAAPTDALSTTGQREKGPRKCSLSGLWENELDSWLRISPLDDAGAFWGSYLTAVTLSDQPSEESPLYGAQHQRAQPTFAFVVHWKFSASTTAFVGQCFVDKKGVEKLETFWLLRKEVPMHDDDWKATLIGKHVFKRIKKE
ncbi:UNVERIFIED_CONTAM: hypothetical protein K2H54_009414 [Gekko kuhli]